MVKYRLHGPKHSAVTEGKVYDLTPAGEGFDFLDDVGEERWTLLPNSIHCERFELIQEGPVRTVTRQEIIPGTYDGVSVQRYAKDPSGVIRVSLFAHDEMHRKMTADELERAAAVLTALAGALRDEQ